MKKCFQKVVLLLSLLSVSLCYADDNERERAMTDGKTVTVGQVSLRVSIAGRCVAGEIISCEISMTNAGKKELSYGHVSDYNDFVVEIKDTSGATIPLTRFGKATLAGDSGERKKLSTKRLLPGETLMRRYNLSRLFDLSVSGDYTITVSREINENQGSDHIVLKVESMSFKVLD